MFIYLIDNITHNLQ